jgi:hypothetical protein
MCTSTNFIKILSLIVTIILLILYLFHLSIIVIYVSLSIKNHTKFFKYACVINKFTTTDLQGMPRVMDTLFFLLKTLII